MTRRARYPRRRGFSLVEILVVIGIIVILLAITVPIAMRLTAGNRLMACEGNLHRIYQALRMYRLDEGGFPPYYYTPDPGTIHGRGLLTLTDLGYLKSFKPLRCPMDTGSYAAGCAPSDFRLDAPYAYDAEDPLSYQWIDPDATPTGGIPAFKYLTARGLAPGDPLEDRVPAHGRGTLWQPDDRTVLTWCQFHYKTITEGGKAQYLVLFYDGHVERVSAESMRQDTWRVAPR